MDKKQLKKLSNEQFGVRPIANIELEPLLKREDIHERLSDCIIEMITSYNLPYYGEFTQFINFWEAKIQTCGVNVTPKGMNFYWDRDWIESRTRKELIFTIIHEVFHLLFDHQRRGIGYDKKIANLAADMIINSIIHGDLMISEGLDKMIEIPKDDKGNNIVVFIDKDYTGPLIFEDVYAYLVEKYNKWKNKNSHKLHKNNNVSVDKDGNITIDGKKYCGKCGQEISDENSKSEKSTQSDNNDDQPDNDQESPNYTGKCDKCGQNIPDNNGNSQGGNNQNDDDENNQNDDDENNQNDDNSYGENGKSGDTGQNKVGMYPIENFFENIEYNKGQSFDIHFDDDVPDAARKQFIESTMEKLKSRGLTSSNIEKVLNKLRKSEKDYLKEIKRNLSNDIFGSYKQKSITKLNRRGIWGLKGTRKYKTVINCLLDTSGSMDGSFERVLSYIFQNDLEINLIQCDTEVKSYTTIKNMSQLEKMPIHGLGGTTLQPGLNYVKDDKELNKYSTVILTDGYCDTLDFSGLKKNILILSTGVNCPTVPGSNSHSIKIKQIIIDKTKNE